MAIYNLNKDDLAVRVLGKMVKDPQEIKTGFEGLDKLTGGLSAGKLYVLGGRPAMGKTTFAFNLLERLAVEQNKKVVYYSLEYPAEQLVEKLIRITSKLIRKEWKKIEEESFEDLHNATEKIRESNIVIEDDIDIDFESKIKNRDNNELKDADVIIVDYLQLIRRTNGDNHRNRQEEQDRIVRTLKYMAQELNVPVIVISQLNRAVDKRSDHRPLLCDLRDVGSLEECADVVLFLYRDEYYEGPYSHEKGVAEIIVAKNHDGNTGVIRMAFIKEFLLFANLYSNSKVKTV